MQGSEISIGEMMDIGDILDMTKDSFVVFSSYRKSFAKLTMEQRGILITAMMNYQMGEELPEMDALTDMAFSFIKDDMDLNNKKYEEKCAKNKANGMKGGRPKANGFSENPNKPNGFFENPTKPNETLYEYEYDYENDNDLKEKEQKKKFVKPSVDEVRAYCSERGNGVDPESFVDFYESKGWKVGSNPMKDWKAAVRTWEKRDPKPANKRSPVSGIPKSVYDKIHDYPERQVDYASLGEELLRGSP